MGRAWPGLPSRPPNGPALRSSGLSSRQMRRATSRNTLLLDGAVHARHFDAWLSGASVRPGLHLALRRLGRDRRRRAAWEKAQYYNLEPPLVALVLGLLISNAVGLPRWLDAGFRVEFYVKTGIVLLGATLPFTLILWAGPVAILQASIVSIATFLVIFFVGNPARPGPAPGGDARRGRRGLRRVRGDRHRRRGPGQEGTSADRHHPRGPLGDRDDLRAAVGRARAASARRRRRRLDRHVGVRRRRRPCRRPDLWRPGRPGTGHRRHAGPGRLCLHADQGGRPRRLDRHLGASCCRSSRSRAGRPPTTRPPGRCRRRSGGAFRNSSSASCSLRCSSRWSSRDASSPITTSS